MAGDQGDYIDQRQETQEPNPRLVADAQPTPDSRQLSGSAGRDRAAASPDVAQSFMNADGSLSTQFKDGSSTRIDTKTQPARVLEVDNSRGEKTTFTYKDSNTTPSGYSFFDASGKEVERGTKEKDGKPWKVERPDAEGKFHKDKSADVMDVRAGGDGRVDIIGKDGFMHERLRNGDQLTRFNDGTGRIVEEKTWSGRNTSYTYNGQDSQPASFTVKGPDGQFQERGVKTPDGWNIYRSADGKPLNPQNLEDPDRKSVV